MAEVNKQTSFFTPVDFSVKFSTTGKKIQGNEKLVLMCKRLLNNNNYLFINFFQIFTKKDYFFVSLFNIQL